MTHKPRIACVPLCCEQTYETDPQDTRSEIGVIAASSDTGKGKVMDIQQLARRCHANSAKWFPTNHLDERAAITHCTLGLAGEAGEVANKVKKLFGYTDQTIPESLRADIAEELIDTLIYDLVLLDLLGADIPHMVERVVAKCVARWGDEAPRYGDRSDGPWCAGCSQVFATLDALDRHLLGSCSSS